MAYSFCPSCHYKQSKINTECEACGLVFSKYLNYTPVKANINKALSASEIKDIRETHKRFTRVKHDRGSKTELIIHCKKNETLDLAAYYLGRSKDREGIKILKGLLSTSYKGSEDVKNSLSSELMKSPFLFISIMILGLVSILAIVLSRYI